MFKPEKSKAEFGYYLLHAYYFTAEFECNDSQKGRESAFSKGTKDN